LPLVGSQFDAASRAGYFRSSVTPISARNVPSKYGVTT
jgi:hypothetical protein